MGNISDDLQELHDAQGADHDGRIKAREADHFVNKKDGQWEPEIYRQFNKQPRYTIDLTSGIVQDICGEIVSMDFDIKVNPSGGPATTEIAQHYDGLIRNIENNSSPAAKFIYQAAAKQMVTTGLGGWGVKVGYRDSTSFDQDLIVYPISNFMDRVWFDTGAELQDMSDANVGWKLTSMSKANYEAMFPDGSKVSVGTDREYTVYDYKDASSVTVCAKYWKKSKEIELVRMTNGSVFEYNEDFEKVQDELSQQGVTIERSRKTKAYTVWHQMFDGADYLTDKKETVFTYIPLIPVFGNFEISEDKVIYWGVVEKHMDPQRILNYAESRKISEGALSPRAKKWMTQEQAAGHQKSLRTLNTNSDPVQFYNHVADQPPPFETGGAQINPGLTETTDSMRGYMNAISGRLDPSRQSGVSLGAHSGEALRRMENLSNTSNYGYISSMEIGITHTAKVIGTAIPKVYDAQREVQLDKQDGTSDTITINQRQYDAQSREVVDLNDLSKGIYSFVASAGPAFQNRQQETVQAFNEIAKIDPSILQTGSDIYLANIPAPGMAQIAARRRAQMVQQGLIPPDELTDDEKQMIQAAQAQPQEPSAMDQALLASAQAETDKVQVEAADIQSKTQERMAKVNLEMQKLALQAQKDENADKLAEMKLELEALKAQDDSIKTNAESLKTTRDAIGADAIVNPANTTAYDKQSVRLADRISN